jgi:hypothetical protein
MKPDTVQRRAETISDIDQRIRFIEPDRGLSDEWWDRWGKGPVPGRSEILIYANRMASALKHAHRLVDELREQVETMSQEGA